MSGDQTSRRAIYGLNVAVAVFAALVIAVLFNWFVDWAYQRLGTSARPWVRYDLTATRAHTLSPQTRAVLGELEGELTLTGLFRADDPQREAVADLLEEYAGFGAQIRVAVLNPERDLPALQALFTKIESGYAEVIGPQRDAVGEGVAQLNALAGAFEAEARALAEVADVLDPEDTLTPKVADLLAVAEADLTQRAEEYRQAAGIFATALDEPLPALDLSRERLVQLLRDAQGDKIPKLRRWLKRQADDRLLPAGVRNAMLVARQRIAEAVPGLPQTVTALGRTVGDVEYQQLREALRAQDCIVVQYGTRVAAVPLSDMYRQDPIGTEADASSVAPLRFLGEERLTGAVLAVQEPVSPLVILVTGDGRPATGRGGQFNMITQRLQYGGFEVAEWHAVPLGGGSVVTAAPRLSEDRRATWIVLPFDAANPAASSAKKVVAEALRERSALGDGVLLVPGFRRDAEFAERDPLVEFAAGAGLRVEPGHLVMYATASEQQRQKAEQTFRVSDWPAGSLLDPAFVGRTAWFEFAHPLTVDAPGVALVTLQAPNLWVERDPLATGTLSDARPEPGESVAEQTIGGVVKVEGGGRLAVVADDLWLTDTVILQRDAGGNAEMLMHTAYWLAGLDHAIAQTPRSQAVRRIGPMTEGQRTAVRLGLLAGLPTAVLLAGGVVWLVRRRG